ncbi:MAG TPA: hypothetical protein VFR24_27535 [Candidatus Angelobacter sp.]|nr:hypothetical protein [Candidatus Angelobacter sp.]
MNKRKQWPEEIKRTFGIWKEMQARCLHKSHDLYHLYGARGIKICDRWLGSFENFLEDMGPHPKGLSIERIDNSKGYSPDNCCWATATVQARNRRTTKLTLELACDLIRLHNTYGYSQRALSCLYQVSERTIRSTVWGKNWAEAKEICEKEILPPNWYQVYWSEGNS